MAFIQGEGRSQGTLFPVTLDELIPEDHVCRVMDAFVGRDVAAEAAKVAMGEPQRMNVIADAGYSNGEQAEACEGKGILPHVSSNRAMNNQGDGTFFDRTAFHSFVYRPAQCFVTVCTRRGLFQVEFCV